MHCSIGFILVSYILTSEWYIRPIYLQYCGAARVYCRVKVIMVKRIDRGFFYNTRMDLFYLIYIYVLMQQFIIHACFKAYHHISIGKMYIYK